MERIIISNMKSKFLLIFAIIIFSLASCDSDDPTSQEKITLVPISEIDLSSFLSEPSGIVYYPINNSFFVVSDTISEIFEIDFNGNLLGQINIAANDIEGITLSKNYDTIFVVEESDNLITSFLINGSKIASFRKDVSTNSSNGLEGITIDNNYNTYVVNEKLPRYLMTLKNNVEVNRSEVTDVEDLSDVCYDQILDCLWIISDESKKIIKISKSESIISEWDLPFSKGEGITFVQDKMYIVRDSDSKLYVFNKPGN
jgi:uncharacterized protein YjiK